MVAAVGRSKQGHIYLNFGDRFPNQTFSARVKSGLELEQAKQYEGKTVSVEGKIELYNGKPEIVADAGKIHVVDPDKGAGK